MTNFEKENKLADLREKAGQIASLACAVSNAAVYGPDSLDTYQEALIYFASATRQLANELKKVTAN